MNAILQSKEWLTPKEVNALYGISVSTLAKWRMNKKNIVFAKIGKFIKYSKEDIEDFLNSKKCILEDEI